MRIITQEMLWRWEQAKVDRELDRLIRESHPASGRARQALRCWLLAMGSVSAGLLLWLWLLGE